MPVNPKDQPNTALAIQFAEQKWGLKAFGWRAQGSVPGSLHPLGRALDIMTTSVSKGNEIANWFIQNANVFGTTEVIWRGQIWTKNQGWHAYTGPSPHTDHVHISLGIIGAVKNFLGNLPNPLEAGQEALAGVISGAANELKRVGFTALFGLGGIALIVLGVQQSVSPTVRKAVGI